MYILFVCFEHQMTVENALNIQKMWTWSSSDYDIYILLHSDDLNPG